MRLFRRVRSRGAPVDIGAVPEFGVRVTLRKGDKIVRRDARGAVRVVRITDEHVDIRHVHRPRPV